MQLFVRHQTFFFLTFVYQHSQSKQIVVSRVWQISAQIFCLLKLVVTCGCILQMSNDYQMSECFNWN